jgi:LCP family protein required for cell wall assembly
MTLLALLVAGLLLGAVAERALAAARRTPETAVAAIRAPRRRRPRRILVWVGVTVLVLVVGGAVGAYLWASAVFDRIERVEVSDELAGGSGTNYLLVGIDNARDPDEQRENVAGSRADTIMVLRVQGGSSMMLSLNRDLLVTNPASGEQGRLNATYNAGEANLVRAVTENYQIPVHRYLEVDFASFGGLVDAFGGIDVDFPHPALDRGSGLVVPDAGTVQLDGDQALAYVRSRYYTEVIDGREVPQGGLPDVNRAERQQVFLREIMKKAGSSRNPVSLVSAASKMSGGLRIDDDMTLLDAGRFAWRMGRLDPETVILPVEPRTTSGGAAILEPGPGADEVLARFR